MPCTEIRVSKLNDDEFKVTYFDIDGLFLGCVITEISEIIADVRMTLADMIPNPEIADAEDK